MPIVPMQVFRTFHLNSIDGPGVDPYTPGPLFTNRAAAMEYIRSTRSGKIENEFVYETVADYQAGVRDRALAKLSPEERRALGV